jgi:hypothetical protein
MAVITLAFVSTFYSGSETLTVILLAGRFFAGASPSWNIGKDSFEVSRVSVVCDLLCQVNLMLVPHMVFAA